MAWTVGKDDIELTKENVKSIEPLSNSILIKDLGSGGGKDYIVNVYKIEMKNGETGIMRLVSGTEDKVLQLIK